MHQPLVHRVCMLQACRHPQCSVPAFATLKPAQHRADTSTSLHDPALIPVQYDSFQIPVACSILTFMWSLWSTQSGGDVKGMPGTAEDLRYPPWDNL